jgi:O-antigen/teichoic acid export membrane protein
VTPKPNRLRFNIAANFLGRGWTTALSLILVPVYIKFLGMEAYGLVGFFASLQMLLNLLDFGLSATMTRELARYSAQPGQAQNMRDLVRTLEVGYWLIGIVIGVGLLILSPWLALHWLKAERLSATTLQQAVGLMAVISFLQWPVSFYTGGLVGLQKQVLLNIVNVSAATLRGVGSVLLLWLVSPTVLAFFSWQAVVSLVYTGAVTLCLWLSLPGRSVRPRFRLAAIRDSWRFAVGIGATSMIGLVLGQLDKVILSTALPLEQFGYYALASTLASALGIPPAPVSDVLVPRYTQLLAQKDETSVRQLFHQGSQVMACLVFPAASVLIFFSQDILRLWTRNAAVAAQAWGMASLLVLGAAINTLMNQADGLQMAGGWLKPGIYARLTAVCVFVPLMAALVPVYGGIGAAVAWLVIYCGYAFFVPPIVFNHLLKGELRRWYVQDTGLPLLVALLVAAAMRWGLPVPHSDWQAILKVVGASLASLGVVSLMLPVSRQLIWKTLAKMLRLREWRLSASGSHRP